jgi:transcriptional regulator with XRE-family HTH domain
MTEQDDNRYLKARNAKGLSQADVSAASGINERTIRKLELGQRVSRRTIREVSLALGIAADYRQADQGDEIVQVEEGVRAEERFQVEKPAVQKPYDPLLDNRPHVVAARQNIAASNKCMLRELMILAPLLIASSVWFFVSAKGAFEEMDNNFVVELSVGESRAQDIDQAIMYPSGWKTFGDYKVVQREAYAESTPKESMRVMRYWLKPLSSSCRKQKCPAEKQDIFAKFSDYVISLPGVLKVRALSKS